jgi:hypothetical protein
VEEVTLVSPGTKKPAAPVATPPKEAPGPTPTDGNPVKRTDDPSAKSKRAPAREPDAAFEAELPTPPLAREAIRTSPRKERGSITRFVRASLAGVGRVAVGRPAVEEQPSRQGSTPIRIFAWTLIGALAVTTVVVLFARQSRTRTEEKLPVASAGVEQQAATLDSLHKFAAAEAASTRASLDSAITAAAPKGVIDSLRDALADADRRSTASAPKASAQKAK